MKGCGYILYKLRKRLPDRKAGGMYFVIQILHLNNLLYPKYEIKEYYVNILILFKLNLLFSYYFLLLKALEDKEDIINT